MITRMLTAAALTLALGVGAAHALVVNYDSHVSGENLGKTTVATLELTQNGADVDFELTNTLAAFPSSFVRYVGFNYIGGPVGSLVGAFTNFGGVVPASISFDPTPPAGNPFNIVVNYNNSNAGGGILRLNPGESSTFTILGVSVADFDFSTGRTQVHVGATQNGESTKYTTPVPLPASALLLLAGLLGVAGLRRRA